MNKHKYFTFLVSILAILFSIILSPFAEARIFDDFVDVSDWEIPLAGGVSSQSLTSVEQADLRAMKVSYTLQANGTNDRTVFIKPKSPKNTRNVIASPLFLKIYGNNSGALVSLRCKDSANEFFLWNGPTITWDGWQEVTFQNLTASNAARFWEGNGIIDGSLKLDAIILNYGPGSEVYTHTIYFADFQVPDFQDGIYVHFGDTAVETTGIYGGSSLPREVVGGKGARKIGAETYFDFDDTYLYGKDDSVAIEFTMEYYDNASSLVGPKLNYYSDSGTTKSTPAYEITGSNTWKSAKFIIRDFDFSNKGQYGTDFSVVGYDVKGTLTPIAIYRLTAKKIAVGSLTGNVTSGGTALAGATIVALHPDYPGNPFQTITDAQGKFAFSKLPVGSLTLFVKKPGSANATIPSVLVNSGQITAVGDVNVTVDYPTGVSALLGRYNDENGLYLKNGVYEGTAFLTEIAGREARRSTLATGNLYFYFDVENQYLTNQVGPVDIIVTYLDQGTDTWQIDYDGKDSVSQAGPIIRKTNSGAWLTKTIRLSDARFANRLLGAHDFRLNAREGDELFAEVKVQKVTTSTFSGASYDLSSLSPIAGTEIVLVSTDFENISYKVTADANGQFTNSDVAVGAYTLTASARGFEPYSAEVVIGEGVNNLELKLNRLRPLLNLSKFTDWKLLPEGGLDAANSALAAKTYENEPALEFKYTLNSMGTNSRYAAFNLPRRHMLITPLVMRIYGNNSGALLVVRCKDNTGEVFQWKGPIVNWSGWQDVVFHLSEESVWVNYGGNENKQIDGGLKLDAVMLDYGAGPEQITGTIYIAAIETGLLPEILEVEFANQDFNNTKGLYGGTNLAFLADANGKPARRTNPGAALYQANFDLDDDYLFGEDSNSAIEIAIDYLDSKASVWGPVLKYQSSRGLVTTKPYETIGSGNWRTAKFIIADYNFSNLMDYSTDFIVNGDIRDSKGLAFTMNRITLRKLPVGTLSGHTDANATVTAIHEAYPSSPLVTQAAGDGSFFFNKLPVGSYSLYVSKPGYSITSVDTLQVIQGQTVTLEPITLVRGYPDGASIKMGRYNVQNGINVSLGAYEGAGFLTELAGSEARRSDRGTGNWYLYFEIDNDYLYDEPGPVDITVTYLDQGTGTWQIDYDGKNSASQAGPLVRKTNSGAWLTKTIRLPDARFANRLLGARDFRLNAQFTSNEDDDYFNAVSVKKVPVTQVTGIIRDANPQLPVSLSGAKVRLQDLNYPNVAYEAQSDGEGRFSCQQVAIGKFQVLISKEGYQATASELDLTETGANLDLTLSEGGFLGFEDSLWEIVTPADGLVLQSEEVRSGNYALEGTGGTEDKLVGTSPLDVKEALRYELSLWIKTDNISSPAGISVNVQELKGNGQSNDWYAGTYKLISTGGTHDWLPFSVILDRKRMKTDTEKIRIYLRVHANVSGKFWVDDVSLVPMLDLSINTDLEEFSPALGQRVKVSYSVPVSAAIKIELATANGDVLSTLLENQILNGSSEFVWDGKSDGEIISDGFYTLKVCAVKDREIVTATKTIKLDSTGPDKPIITAPNLESGKLFYHNQQQVSLAGFINELGTIKAYRTQDDVQEEIGAGIADDTGRFSLNATLLPDQENRIYLIAYDSLGNPSVQSDLWQIFYDGDYPIGLPVIENDELISPRNFDGIKDKLVVSFYTNAAGTIDFQLKNNAGVALYTQEQQTLGNKLVTVTWDGKNTQQNYVPDGIYRYSLSFTNESRSITVASGEIEIDNTPPLAPLLIYPAADGTVTAKQIILRWEAVADAVAYELVYGPKADLLGVEPIKLVTPSYFLENLQLGSWYWQVTALDKAGNKSIASEGKFQVTELDQSAFEITNFSLLPNPFSPNQDGRRDTVSISYTLRQSAAVKISIYNLAGHLVKTIDVGQQIAGDQQVSWDGTDQKHKLVAPGIYIIHLVGKNASYVATASKKQPLLVIR